MTNRSHPIVRPAALGDMDACAAIVNAWIDETEWMPRLHTPESVRAFYRDTVFAEREVFVAIIEDMLCGFASVTSDATITALYVESARRKRGLGKLLLDRLKAERPCGLELWTMQANRAAQRFYQREGFKEIRRTDGENEESLPDILYRWPSEARA